MLWGLLAFICNFIPYVGFVIGLIPPALLALLGGDWRLMILIIVAYIVLNSLFTTLLQSYFVGNAVGLSVTLTRYCNDDVSRARLSNAWRRRGRFSH